MLHHTIHHHTIRFPMILYILQNLHLSLHVPRKIKLYIFQYFLRLFILHLVGEEWILVHVLLLFIWVFIKVPFSLMNRLLYIHLGLLKTLIIFLLFIHLVYRHTLRSPKDVRSN